MKHLMNKVSLMVAVDRRAEGHVLNQELGHWFLSNLVPELEALFDQLIPEDQLLRLDQLELELPAISIHNWQGQLRVAILEALETQLKLILAGKGTNGKFIPSVQGHFEAWLYFLLHGQLPSNYAAVPEQERLNAVLQEVSARRTALERLLHTLRKSTPSIERLVKQHDRVFLIRLAGAVCGRPLEPLFAAFQTLGNFLLEPDFRAWVLDYTSGLKSKVAPSPSSLKSPTLTPHSWPKEEASVAKALNQKLALVFFREVSETGGLMQEEPLLKKAFQDLFKELYEIDFEIFVKKINAQKGIKRANILLARTQNLPLFARKIIQELLPILPVAAHKKQDDLASKKLVLSAEKPDPVKQHEGETLQEEVGTSVPAPETNTTLSPDLGIASPPLAEALRLESSEQTRIQQLETLDEATTEKATAAFEEPLDETPQFLQNAGLVLLHPFLAHLFEHCAYTEGKAFRSDYTCMQAIQLLHYIATGERGAPEYELYLPKILCAWEIPKPIEREFLPTPDHVQEAENMMQAAIQHWGALGKVSNESLRQGFLQRPGKISPREDNYLLQVEHQTLDILLQKLPWGIGIFKLPWMKKLLYVEWNT